MLSGEDPPYGFRLIGKLSSVGSDISEAGCGHVCCNAMLGGRVEIAECPYIGVMA